VVRLVKITVASALIFGAGAYCGFKYAQLRHQVLGWTPPAIQRVELLRKAAVEVGLDKAQLEHIESAVAATRRRLKDLMQPSSGVMREELKLLQEKVTHELTADQKRRFDDWLARYRKTMETARKSVFTGEWTSATNSAITNR
jgi:hypothetical protein